MPVQHDGLDVQYVDLNGARLAYRIKGSRDKSLMINLHGGRGFGSHGREFAAWKELSDQLCVVAFDFRGHGLSSDTEPYIFAQIVEDIEALRRHLVADRPAIIQGGSFGGFLAQQYALTYPQYTSHLILRGTAPSHHHEAEAKANFLARAAVKAPLASPEMLDKVFGAFQDDTEMRLIMFAIGPLYSEGSYDGNRALEAACTTRYNAKAHNDLYSQTEKYFDYREQLKTLETPTLIIAGADDWITDPAQSRLLHSLIKNSRLVIMPDANHSVHEEKHEEVIALVRQFIQSS